MLLFKNDKTAPGLKMRNSTKGAEFQLVNDFIDDFMFRHKRKSKIHDYAIFIEPKIDSGYPDFVIVKYKHALMESWSEDRPFLSENDLKILSYLMKVGNATYDDIMEYLGFRSIQIEKSIDILEKCKMVRSYRGSAKTVRPMNFFGAIEISAYEAKINATSAAIAQAARNIRFSTGSYVLLGSKRPTESTKAACEKAGVGLICKDSLSKPLISNRRQISQAYSCYVALLFNEWVARGINAGAYCA